MGPQEARDPSWDVIWAEILTGDLWDIPMDAGSPEAPKVLAGGEQQAGPFMRKYRRKCRVLLSKHIKGFEME